MAGYEEHTHLLYVFFRVAFFEYRTPCCQGLCKWVTLQMYLFDPTTIGQGEGDLGVTVIYVWRRYKSPSNKHLFRIRLYIEHLLGSFFVTVTIIRLTMKFLYDSLCNSGYFMKFYLALITLSLDFIKVSTNNFVNFGRVFFHYLWCHLRALG